MRATLGASAFAIGAHAFSSTPTCPEYPSPYGPSMYCGTTVKQCGVLAIDTGLGTYGGIGGAIADNVNTGGTDQTNPPYSLPEAKVHGLWFEGPPYGVCARTIAIHIIICHMT